MPKLADKPAVLDTLQERQIANDAVQKSLEFLRAQKATLPVYEDHESAHDAIGAANSTLQTCINHLEMEAAILHEMLLTGGAPVTEG